MIFSGQGNYKSNFRLKPFILILICFNLLSGLCSRCWLVFMEHAWETCKGERTCALQQNSWMYIIIVFRFTGRTNRVSVVLCFQGIVLMYRVHNNVWRAINIIILRPRQLCLVLTVTSVLYVHSALEHSQPWEQAE